MIHTHFSVYEKEKSKYKSRASDLDFPVRSNTMVSLDVASVPELPKQKKMPRLLC